MKDAELLDALNRVSESAYLLRRLLRMPSHQIEDAIALLSNPESVEQLRRLLHEVNRMHDRKQRSYASSRASSFDLFHGQELHAMLDSLFSDRGRFDSVASIHKFVKDVFRINVRPAKKEGRQRYIRKVVGRIENNPKAMKNAQNVLKHASVEMQKDQAYTSLYNFIRGRLTE